MALVHHPVVDRNEQVIAASVTNLDLHDIARSARTFGIEAFFVVTPLADQQVLVSRIIDHWVGGAGATYNPDRREALALIQLQPSLSDARQAVAQRHGIMPKTVVTSARMADSNLSYAGLRELAGKDVPLMLIFGTAWGLAPEIIAGADYRLNPISGRGTYNHLAVRSAVAIILDRVLGER